MAKWLRLFIVSNSGGKNGRDRRWQYRCARNKRRVERGAGTSCAAIRAWNTGRTIVANRALSLRMIPIENCSGARQCRSSINGLSGTADGYGRTRHGQQMKNQGRLLLRLLIQALRIRMRIWRRICGTGPSALISGNALGGCVHGYDFEFEDKDRIHRITSLATPVSAPMLPVRCGDKITAPALSALLRAQRLWH